MGCMVMETSQSQTERKVDSRPQQVVRHPDIREETEEALGRLRAGRSLSSRHLNLILRSPKGIITLAQMGAFRGI